MNPDGDIVPEKYLKEMPKYKGPWYKIPEKKLPGLEKGNRHERRKWLKKNKKKLVKWENKS